MSERPTGTRRLNGRRVDLPARASDVLLQHVDLGTATTIVHTHVQVQRWSVLDHVAMVIALVAVFSFASLLVLGSLEAPVWLGWTAYGVLGSAVIAGVIVIVFAVRQHRRHET